MFVFVGRVDRAEEDGDGVALTFRIEAEEKALVPLGEEVVTIHYRRGLGDDEGQHSPLMAGERARVFLITSMEPGGRLELLEPNGWEPV